MAQPTSNERSPLIQPSVSSYQLPAQSIIQVDPAVLARTMQILSNQMAANQRSQPPAPPIANATVQQSLQLPDGQYVGGVKDGLPHGMGTLTYHPGHERKLYEGEWQKGEFHGRGVLKFSNGCEHQGQWENGMLHGQGLQFFADGGKYEGSFVKDKKHGEGTTRWANGDIYTGTWKNDLRTGQGTYRWPNGNEYVGEWRENKRNGKGSETETDGDYYIGEWQNDERHGQGKRGYTRSGIFFTREGIWRNGNFWSGNYFQGKTVDGVDVPDPFCCSIL